MNIANKLINKFIFGSALKVIKRYTVIPVLFFLTKHHAMKAYWGSGDIAPHIL